MTAAIEQAAGCTTTATAFCKSTESKSTAIGKPEQFAMNIAGTEPRVSCQMLAKRLRNQHRASHRADRQVPGNLRQLRQGAFSKGIFAGQPDRAKWSVSRC